MALFKKAPARGVLGAQEAAHFLGVGEDDIVRAIEEQNLPARRLGGRWLIAQDALVRWLEAGTAPVAPLPPDPEPKPEAKPEPEPEHQPELAEVEPEPKPVEEESVEPAPVEPPRPRLPLYLTAFNLRHLPANALWAL